MYVYRNKEYVSTTTSTTRATKGSESFKNDELDFKLLKPQYLAKCGWGFFYFKKEWFQKGQEKRGKKSWTNREDSQVPPLSF